MSPVRILALGDSYTIGEGVAPEARWPERLADALRADGLDVTPPDLVAVTGWTTEELGTALAGTTLSPPYDLVTLLVGVNDQYRGHGLDTIRRAYAARLADAVRFVGGRPARVVAVSVPDWGVTPFGAADPRGPHGIAREIDALNDAERVLAEAAGVTWVDITALSREQGDQTVDDGLHPDADAYAAWSEHIRPVAQATLAS